MPMAFSSLFCHRRFPGNRWHWKKNHLQNNQKKRTMQIGKKRHLRNRLKCWVLSTARLLHPKFPPVGASHQQERSFFSITLTVSSVLMEANHTEQFGWLLEKFWALDRIYTYRYVLEIRKKYIHIYIWKLIQIYPVLQGHTWDQCNSPRPDFTSAARIAPKHAQKTWLLWGLFKTP